MAEEQGRSIGWSITHDTKTRRKRGLPQQDYCTNKGMKKKGKE